eukprot:3388452-Rhodomonas_salina.1
MYIVEEIFPNTTARGHGRNGLLMGVWNGVWNGGLAGQCGGRWCGEGNEVVVCVWGGARRGGGGKIATGGREQRLKPGEEEA